VNSARPKEGPSPLTMHSPKDSAVPSRSTIATVIEISNAPLGAAALAAAKAARHGAAPVRARPLRPVILGGSMATFSAGLGFAVITATLATFLSVSAHAADTSATPAQSAQPVEGFAAGQAACTLDDQCPAGTLCVEGLCASTRKGQAQKKDQPESSAAQANKLLVLPPFVHSRDSQGHTTTVFPFYWSLRDNSSQSESTAVLPFFLRRTSPRSATTAAGVFPFMGYAQDHGAAGAGGGFAPFAFFGRREDRRHALVLPFFYHWASRQSAFTLAAPFFFQDKDQPAPDGQFQRTRLGIPPLLYFQGQDALGSYKVQFPFFWRFQDRLTQKTTTVVPPVWYESAPDGSWNMGVPPLLFAGASEGRKHFVLFPLFWRLNDNAESKTTTVVANYLHRTHGAETTDALFPFFHYRRGAKPGHAPESSLTLFPLFHRRKSPSEDILISPVAAWKRTESKTAGFVLPYFWFNDSQVSASGVPPLWFDHYSKHERRRTRIAGPWFAVDTPSLKTRGLFPFFGHYEERDKDTDQWKESGTFVLPAYFRQRTAKGYALDTVFPLFWRSKSPDSYALQLGPWFTHREKKKYTTGLVPAFVYARNPERSLLVTPLSYYRHNFSTHEKKLWAGLLYYRRSDPKSSWSTLFPLWWSEHNEARTRRFLVPFYWHLADHKEDTATTVAGPLFWAHNKSSRTYGLAPLGWFSSDAEKKESSFALLPLLYKKSGPKRSALATALFGFGHSPTSSWWYVPPFLWRNSDKSNFNMLFPFWVSHTNKETETNTRFFLPALHFQRKSADKTLAAWFGILWRHDGIASSTNVVFPFFFDHHSFHESRTTALLPLFLRHHRLTDDTAYTMAPFFYRRSGPKESTTVLFPLFWDFKEETKRSTLLLPLFAHFSKPGHTSTWVFPNIYYRNGRGANAGTHRLVVWPFWDSQVRQPGDYSWDVLLGLFGYEREGLERQVKFFFVPFELDPLPPPQTAWYGRGRQKSSPNDNNRPAPAQGFTGHIW